MKEKLEQLLNDAIKVLGLPSENVSVSYPKEEGRGDYMTSVPLSVAKTAGKNPKEVAEQIVVTLRKTQDEFPFVKEIQVAGPGFINFYLSRDYFSGVLNDVLKKGENYGKGTTLAEEKIMIEYTQPNPFKPFHIGHLMSNAIGESLSRLIESQGANLVRANYQGDIGPHVAKAIYGILKKGGEIKGSSVSEKAGYIGECYAFGSDKYESDENTKKEIDEINKKLYAGDVEYKSLYDEGRKITLEAFEELYKTLGTKFDKYYFESEVAEKGVIFVKKYPKIFEESKGAIVFHAENYYPKLHTRVFVTKHGLPTYEAKELGLAQIKKDDFSYDSSLTVTANEQDAFFDVVAVAIGEIFPELKGKLEHISHGMMRFAEGKMSSRKGNVITGESLIRDAKQAIMEKMKDRDYTGSEKEQISEAVGVSAIKYSILRSSTGSDIIFDFEKSISFEGDSGPYLQYTATRAKSVLEKANLAKIQPTTNNPQPDSTLTLERLLERFPSVVSRACAERQPHHVVTYLVELAGAFNAFYAKEQIVVADDPSSPYKVAVTKALHQVLSNGLNLLGIRLPEKM